MTDARAASSWRSAPVVAVWAAAVVAAVVVLIAVPGFDVFAGLALTLCGGVVVSFVAQLLVGEQAGFVARLAAGVTGVFAVVVLAAVVAAVRLAA